MLTFHELRVAEARPEAEDALAVALEVPETLREAYRFEAGQHVVLRARIDGEELRRTYSLANAPGEWPLRLALRVHDRGRFSRYLAQQARPGAELEVLPAGGSFVARRSQQGRRCFVAFVSGSGIAPVLSIVTATLAADPASRFVVFYGNRSVGRAMLIEELLALKDRYLERLALHFIMSREPQEIALYNGRLDGAKVRELAGRLFDAGSVADFFLCGPGTMIDDVTGALRALGAEAARIHAEHFTLVSSETLPASHTEVGDAGAAEIGATEATEVTVIMDGRRRRFSMGAGETVLDAGLAAGLELPYSCHAGVCGTCRTRLVRGRVDMEQNLALEPGEVEAGYVLACQSRPLTAELEIDYDEK